MKSRIEKLEIIGSLSWFLMDFAWYQELEILSYIGCWVSLISFYSILIFSFSCSNAALLCWLLMNIFWMLQPYSDLLGFLTGIDLPLFLGYLGIIFLLLSLLIEKNIKNFIRLKNGKF